MTQVEAWIADDPQLSEAPAPVRIHLVSGGTIDVHVEKDELEDGDTLEEHIERQLSEPPRPHWCAFGAAAVFTQAIAAVEIL